MSNEADLEERTVFADDEDGGTLALSRPPPSREKRADPESTQSVRAERAERAERNTIPEPPPREELTQETFDDVHETDHLVDRTGYAAEGVRLAVLFAHHFGRRPLGERGHLILRLNEPGLSTDGGAKARQSLVLVPKDERRGTTTIGWLDASRLVAEIKSYALVAEQHRARRHQELDISREDYERLHDDLTTFLRASGITPSVSDIRSAAAAARAAPPSAVRELAVTPRSIGAIIAMILSIGILIGVVASRGCGSEEVHELQLDGEDERPAQDLRPEPRLWPKRTR